MQNAKNFKTIYYTVMISKALPCHFGEKDYDSGLTHRDLCCKKPTRSYPASRTGDAEAVKTWYESTTAAA
jgi:hypothetical protein